MNGRHLREAMNASGRTPNGSQCVGAKFHSPTPLFSEEVEIAPGKFVTLCGTCRDNLKVYEELKRHYEGEIPWPVRREFGNLIRAIGDVAQ